MKNSFPFFLVLLIFFSNARAQQKTGQLIGEWADDENKVAKAISLYPATQRNAILEAAAHPEILVRMQSIRERTERQFRTLLEPLSEEERKDIYNLIRYPDLVSRIIAEEEKRPDKEMTKITEDYPHDVKTAALRANKKHFGALVKAHGLYEDSHNAFDRLLMDYDDVTQEAYRTLVKLPEVLDILANDIRMTVLLGDIYRKDPQSLKRELDSLNVIMAEEKAKELKEWQESLRNDPEAMAEMEAAAQQFADEQGSSETEYKAPVSEDRISEVRVVHTWEPYPYWFGWPWWYTYESWYPYPWWYHWGFYYGPHNAIVFIGLPSPFFMHWHFYHPAHLYRYPQFTGRIVHYYYGHRNSGNSVTYVTENWINRTRSVLKEDWLADESTRVDRIREYGRLKMEQEEWTARNSGLIPDRDIREERYPALKPVLREEATTPQPVQPQRPEPSWPAKPPPATTEKPRENIIYDKPSERQRIERARDYHRDTWERPVSRPKTEPQPTTPKPQSQEKIPPPRPQPQPKPAEQKPATPRPGKTP